MKKILDKFELYGEKSLSDLEILFILLGKRNTNKIVRLYEDISKRKDLYSCMYDLQIHELVNQYGFTINEARKFKVVCEFAKRFNTPIHLEKKVIKSAQDVNNLLTKGEQPIAAYKTFRDSAIFTNKRLIIRDAQGLTGTKVEIYSLPYSSILMWSTENAGVIDINAEVQLWTRMGMIKVKLRKGIDVRRFDTLLANSILSE